uniref:Putative secreted protein n=1 Tax=Ixodes ricinus TaxID=34613 RepID=A0A6B0U2V4_IXORI
MPSHQPSPMSLLMTVTVSFAQIVISPAAWGSKSYRARACKSDVKNAAAHRGTGPRPLDRVIDASERSSNGHGQRVRGNVACFVSTAGD